MDKAQPLAVHSVICNQASVLPELFASLDQQTWKLFQTTIVDNASQDGGLVWLQLQRPEVVTLRNPRPQAWVRAHNQALALSLSRWPEHALPERFIALIQPTCVLAADVFERALLAFAQDPSLMIVGPRTLHAALTLADDESRQIECTRRIESGEMRLARSRLVKRLEQGFLMPDETPLVRPVFALAGSCLIVRASMWKRLSDSDETYLDPDLPPFQAVLDLCWRARWRGLSVGLLEGTCVWRVSHPEPRLTRSLPRLRRFYGRAARERRAECYFIGRVRAKNDPWSVRLRHLPWIILGCFKRLGLLCLDVGLWRQVDFSPTLWLRLVKKRRRFFSAPHQPPANVSRWFV